MPNHNTWTFDPQPEASEPHRPASSSAMTYKYVVKRTAYNAIEDEHDRSQASSSASSLGYSNSEAHVGDDSFDEVTVLAQNHRLPTEQQDEVAAVAALEQELEQESVFFTADFSNNLRQEEEYYTDAKDTTRIPPASPTGVLDELESGFFSVESFGTDFFHDEKNPFRASADSNAPKFQRVQRNPATPKSAASAPISATAAPPAAAAAPVSPAKEVKTNNIYSTPIKTPAVKVDSSPSKKSTAKAVSPRIRTPESTSQEDEGQSSSSLSGSKAPSLKRPQGAKAKPAAPAATTTTLPAKSPPTNFRLEEVMTSKLRLYIDDYDGDFFEKLMYNLSGQLCVQKLDIYRSAVPAKRKRTPSEMKLFHKVVQSLPNLHTLHLSNMDALTDLDYFPDAVFGHRKLQFIQMHLVRGGIGATTLRSLNTIPRLTEVSFRTPESFDFSILLQSTTLRRLHISASASSSSSNKNNNVGSGSAVFAFENAHIMSMVPMLECNRVLIELDLEPEMSFLAFKFLAYSLRINRSMQVLQVGIEATSSQLLIEQAMTEISTVLTMNPTLRVLNNANRRNLHVGLSSCRKILRALDTNITMEQFNLFHEDATFANRKRQLLKPMDTSKASMNKSFGDGTTYRSFMASYYTQDESSDDSIEEEETVESTLPQFCGGLPDAVDLAVVATETKRLFGEVQQQVFQLWNHINPFPGAKRRGTSTASPKKSRRSRK